VLALLTCWLAARRFGVDTRLAAAGVAVAAASPPLAVYGQQLYPEVPAALLTVVGVAAATGRVRLPVVVLVVAALPWLSIKYAPVAAGLALVAGVLVWRAGRYRELVVAAGSVVLAGIGYLLVHRLVWGGWTVYASGDHFQSTGEFGAVGFRPNYAGRAQRLASLFVDQRFGIAAWQPAWLLVVPAVAAMLARRPRGWPVLLVPLAAGWLVATFVAVTMHGYWWPGRQLVVVLPLAVVAVLWWLHQLPTPARLLAAVLGLTGVLTYGWLLADGWARRITWVSGFWQTGAPAYRLSRPLLPDYTGEAYLASHVAWVAVLVGLAAAGWWSVRATATSPASTAGG
jgi:hypothetical protein